MAILILLICFIAVFINTGILLPPATGKREVLICSVLIFSGLVVLVTEVLSALRSISYGYILLLWVLITLLNVAYLYAKKTRAVDLIKGLQRRISPVYTGLSRFERFLLFSVAGILALVFVQGIIYPPNNWDSMTYHMARIPNWISHRSVAPYPTHITRQIYQPPFAEYMIMNFDILNRSDYFSASVQFFFFLFALTAIAAMVKNSGLSTYYQFAAVFLGATIPEVTLQASSTQNDIVTGFFVLAACYFAIKAVKGPAFNNYLFLGLAAGLCILTKGTAYIYLAPILLLFGVMVLIRLFKTKRFTCLWYGIIVILIIISINAPQYCRNYSISNNIFGTDSKELQGYANEAMSPALFLSAVIKNAGSQMGMEGTNRIADLSNKVVYKLDAVLGVKINDPKNNYGHNIYSAPIGMANHEDTAPNLVHFLLIISACVLICIYYFKGEHSIRILILLLTILLQAVLFCAYLKWQPWNTRLYVPLFMLAVPLVCYGMSINNRFKKFAAYIAIPVILLYAVVIIVDNNTRPYLIMSNNRIGVTTKTPFLNARYKNYFANIPYDYPEYDAIVNVIKNNRYSNIGLLTGGDTFEYPLFADCYSQAINPVSIMVNNYTKNIEPAIRNVDCIVAAAVNSAYIDYNGKRFYKQDSNNKYIHLYK